MDKYGFDNNLEKFEVVWMQNSLSENLWTTYKISIYESAIIIFNDDKFNLLLIVSENVSHWFWCILNSIPLNLTSLFSKI